MNIGISTSVIQRGQTGIAQYLFALIRALVEHGKHRYTLFVLDKDAQLFDFADGKLTIAIVPERFRHPMRDILWHQAALPRLVKQFGLDVLHVPSYRRMLSSSPCPVVATVHDLAPFRIARKYSWARMVYARFIVPQLARRQDQIVAVSQSTADDASRFLNVSSGRLNVVYNGIDHSRFFPGNGVKSKSEVGERFSLKKPFFLYVARLEHPGKNHIRLIEAFNRFKAARESDWELVLAGADWHGANQIHDAIRESPFARDIRVLGFVHDTFLPDLYRAAGVFVYPSLFEGFGMPPIEAMACGCPVISSARGSLEEVLGNAATRVNPEDVDAISTELGLVSGNAELRERMSAAGLAQAARFNWATTATETVAVYERAAGAVRN